MLKFSSARERKQLIDSIEKLFHYLLVYVKHDTVVKVGDLHEFNYRAPREVSISPTLYTRLDDCHGAGNCCRVPFDLVYSPYDYERIRKYDHARARCDFGEASAEKFLSYREDLLNSLVRVECEVRQAGETWRTAILVRQNKVVQKISGNHSCPYLYASDDRYFCGVHPFKPLHCWYPHMTVRTTDPRYHSDGRPTVSIGRMQYGRNHKFGCPVIFQESEPRQSIFEQTFNYFDRQFDADIAKLKWTALSAMSLGFKEEHSVAPVLDIELRALSSVIMTALSGNTRPPIPFWRRHAP